MAKKNQREVRRPEDWFPPARFVDSASTGDVADALAAVDINTTAPLTGGGNLSADRTLAITAATGAAAGSMSAADKTKLDAISGTNTGDQTSIVGITGTKAQFDTALTDGDFLYVGDISDAAYGVGWDASLLAPTQNAVYDKIETLQPLDADLTAIAALTTTAFGRDHLVLADAAALRTKAGLGTIATAAAGDYLPIGGGTLMGALTGTSATFSGIIRSNVTSGSPATPHFHAVDGVVEAVFGAQSGGPNAFLGTYSAHDTVLVHTQSEKARVTATGLTVTGTITASNVGVFNVAGIPLYLNATNSQAEKIVLQDAGVTRGYVGANATGPYLADGTPTIRAQVSGTGVDITGDVTATGQINTGSGFRDSGNRMARFESTAGFIAAGSTGVGVDIFVYLGDANVRSYNHSTAAYSILNLPGSAINIQPAGSTVGAFSAAGLAVTGSISASTTIKPGSFTVATLPSAAAAGDGALAFASDGRKSGEGAGAGTGLFAYADGGSWYRPADDTVVAA